METFQTDGHPLAAYLEGEGHLDHTLGEVEPVTRSSHAEADGDALQTSFAPNSPLHPYSGLVKHIPKFERTTPKARSSIGKIHDAWSTAVNSRLGRADNARFLEHFRYIIVASQLLNEYLDQGSLPPPSAVQSFDGTSDARSIPIVAISTYGATCTALVAFALVYLIHWARSGRAGSGNGARFALVLLVFLLVAFVGYGYIRRQWLKFLRRNAVLEVTGLTVSWQSFEVSASSALSLIQEVELVSRGYRLSAPLPPASRIEDQTVAKRCVRLRRSLHNAYGSIIPTCIDASSAVRSLIDRDDLEKYFEVYDISAQDAREALESDAQMLLEDDEESLKALRVQSYRTNILRRVFLCSLMALEADGGKPDFQRWRQATEAMRTVAQSISRSTESVQQCLRDMESIPLPPSPMHHKVNGTGAREKFRGQVRKISMLSSGIKTLQAKMQILREETNRSIEQSEEVSDLGPSLMSQYDAIGEDLKDLMAAWEAGKATLQVNLSKQERRISLASSTSASRSAVSSIGGLTAVEEDSNSSNGGPAAALRILTGEAKSLSNRSSMATTPSDEEVFEAMAMPRQRSSLTREERIIKMQEERERQAVMRAKRDANTSMLRELESVINLRPKNKNTAARVTSI